MQPLRESFRVRSYEVDPRRRLALRALCAYLQEAAGLHAARLGASMERLAESGLAWVLHRMKVELAECPRQGDELEVVTWPSGFDRVLADREFEVFRGSARVAAATTRWAVADVRARRPVRMPEFIQALAVGERLAGLAIDRGDLPAPSGPPAATRTFAVRLSDLDVVGHVNNTQYVGWVAETVPEEALAGWPTALEIVYRQEARYGDVVVSESAPLGSGGLAFAHALRRQADGAELARALTRWTR
ncbi:MAG TPA: acyl-ACP thioesterase domain-containing protein [Vicinamibacteria bacterium]|nr:acyl-ACP thioesterase domain-containing protein [Vicinamibacteria bacterium]